MIFHETSPDTFAEVTGDLTYNDAIVPRQNLDLWSDEELAAVACYRLDIPAAPDGKMLGSYTVARVDGVVQIVPEWIDRPAPPAPEPRKLSKRVLVERLAAVGKLSAAFSILGGPGQLPYERWQASTYVDTTNADVIALLTAIGGDVDALLAPEDNG